MDEEKGYKCTVTSRFSLGFVQDSEVSARLFTLVSGILLEFLSLLLVLDKFILLYQDEPEVLPACKSGDEPLTAIIEFDSSKEENGCRQWCTLCLNVATLLRKKPS